MPHEHNPARRAKNTLKPLGVVGAAGTGNPNTPRLNARKAEKQRNEAAIQKGSVLDEIKRLPADSEGRRIYTQVASKQGGTAAKEAYLTWKAAQA